MFCEQFVHNKHVYNQQQPRTIKPNAFYYLNKILFSNLFTTKQSIYLNLKFHLNLYTIT